MLAYYVTAHGYGHSVRTCQVLEALYDADPNLEVALITGVEEGFFLNRIGRAPAIHREGRFDLGMVQLDSVRVDVDATLEGVYALHRCRDDRVARETAFLRENEIRGVVVDVPAMPLESAARAGIPGIAVANFGWDWIYEDFAGGDPRWDEVIGGFREGYARASLSLRLPFSEPLESFGNVLDVPLMARPGVADREALAALTGADPSRTWVLLSWTTLDWPERSLDRAAALRNYEFFTIKPLSWDRPNMHMIDREAFAIADTFATVDIVLSKPGFGLLSECVVNDKPLVYVERENFREYPVLESGLKRYLRHVHLPAEQLYAGEIAGALEAIRDAPPPGERLESDGGRRAAELILRALNGTR